MAKKKFSVDALRAAGAAAHMQPKKSDLVEIAEIVGGEVLKEIPVNEIENNPMQPRISIDDDTLQELALSIKTDGLITPISVYQKGENGYILKAGQRRWLAHKLLKREKIKAIVSSQPMSAPIEEERRYFEVAISENLHRDDLDPLEIAISLQDAITKGLYKTAEEAAHGIKKTKSFVSKLLKVLKLDSEIIEDLKRNRSTKDIESLYLIQKITPASKQIEIYNDFIQKKIDRAGLRQLLKRKVSHAKQSPYEIINRGNHVTIKVNVASLESDKKELFEKELEEIIKKYV